MKILITGGGLLGSVVLKQLRAEGHHVCVVDIFDCKKYLDFVSDVNCDFVMGDITDSEFVATLLKQVRPEAVIHTAGVMARGFEENLPRALKTNIMGAVGLAHMCKLAGVRQFVYASSLAVYDFSNSSQRLSETSMNTSTDVYGLTKLYVEKMLCTFTSDAFNVVILRFAGIFGFSPFYGGAWMGSLLQNYCMQLLDKKFVPLDLHLLGWTEYLYVVDAAVATCLAVKLREPMILNIGSEMVTSPEEVAKSFVNVFGARFSDFKIPGTSQGVEDYLQREFPLDISLAKKILNFKPEFTKFEAALTHFRNVLLDARRSNIEVFCH